MITFIQFMTNFAEAAFLNHSKISLHGGIKLAGGIVRKSF